MKPRFRLSGLMVRHSNPLDVADLLVAQLGCSPADPTPGIEIASTTVRNGTATVYLGALDGSRPAITAMVVSTDDLGAAERHFVACRATIISEHPNALVLVDPDGLEVVVIDSSDTTAPAERSNDRPHLHHVSITTEHLARSSNFYERVLGLVPVYDLGDGAEVKLRFLADSEVQHGGHEYLLEIMGPPFLDREQAAVKRFGGPCFDHYCFTTDDPAELHGHCVRGQFRTSEDPEFIEEFDLTLSYLFGPDDIEIELMNRPDPKTLTYPGA